MNTNISTKELLENWYRRSRESQFSHYEMAKRLERMNYLIGIPSIILSTILGTSIFATLGKSIDIIFQIGFGLISVIAAVLTGLQTFLRLSEKVEKHRSIASKYGSLRRQIEELLSMEENIEREVITKLRESLDSLAEDAPNISDNIWSKTQKKLKDNDTSFLNRYKNQNKI